MKILRVISSMNPTAGGPCQGIRNTIPELTKLNIETEVVSLDDPGMPFLDKDSFKIIALGPAVGPWAYSAKLIPWLKENIANYDAIIIHGLWLYHSYAVNKVVQKLKSVNIKNGSGLNVPKLYVMPHGMLDPYFQKAKERRLKAIRNWFYYKLIEAKVVNDADALLFTCQAELELARLPFQPYSPRNEINVGYGIASPPAVEENYFLAKFPQFVQKPYLLFLSRIHIKKGVDLLISAYRELQKQGFKLPALVIAGPGMDTEYGEKLEKLAGSELNNSIFFPGMLKGDLKWGAFYGSEGFVLPSHQENFGIAVAEALACGVPVLISNQVNIWQEIQNGGGGFVENDDLQGTVNLLKKWSLLPEKMKQGMRISAKKVFENNFSIEPAAKKLVEEVFV